MVSCGIMFFILLRSGFEHKVERRLGSAAEAGKSAFGSHCAEPLFTSLRTQGKPDLLRLGSRRTHHGRRTIAKSPDGIQVVLQIVIGERLNDKPRSIRLERAADVSGS